MTPENKKIWVDALRSGKFKQGHGKLCRYIGPGDGYEYCCLGVAAEVLYDGEWVRSTQDTLRYGFGDIGDSDYLNTTSLIASIKEEIGLDYGAESLLIQLNDNRGKNFLQIADWIEANL